MNYQIVKKQLKIYSKNSSTRARNENWASLEDEAFLKLLSFVHKYSKK